MRSYWLLLLAFGCRDKDDTGFPIYHHKDSEDSEPDPGTPTDTGDFGWDSGMENGGGGADTWNAVWVRCEQEGLSWTFHAELNYAAANVVVELAQGDATYEVWYLSPQGQDRQVWEVTVGDGLSAHTCAETIALRWTAYGTDWDVAYESLYTPP